MKSYRRAALVALACLAGVLAACSGSGLRGSLTPPASQQAVGANAQIATQTIRDAAGATIDVRGGNTVSFAPRALGGDRAIRVTRDDSTVAAPPNPAWSMIGGTLDVRFDRALRSPHSVASAMRLTLSYPKGRAEEILHARMPLTVVTYANGSSQRFGFEGAFDVRNHRVTVDVPQAVLENAVDVKVGMAVDNATYTLPPPGPRYWTGTSWSQTGTIDPTKRTLVMIHGIFSSVETAFPNPCTPEIMKAGGYQQAVGFDYNWTDPPQVEGPLFAAFLNSLVQQKLTTFDIEAHSYGSPVAYAALPSVTGATIPNVVTLGGPLPLRGTPLAKKGLLRLVLVALADIFVGPPSLINHAYSSGMVSAMATDSTEMQAILAGINGMKTKPDFVDVAGTKEYPQEALLYPLLYFYINYPWDGIVEKLAANSVDIPNSFPNSFYEEHTELECAGSVIAYVGSQVAPKGRHPKTLRFTLR
jgi:hypothetical protein